MTRGVLFGKRYGIVAAMEIATGLLLHKSLTALGVALIIQAVPGLFSMTTYLGGFYLIYLEIQTFKSREMLELGETISQSSY